MASSSLRRLLDDLRILGVAAVGVGVLGAWAITTSLRPEPRRGELVSGVEAFRIQDGVAPAPRAPFHEDPLSPLTQGDTLTVIRALDRQPLPGADVLVGMAGVTPGFEGVAYDEGTVTLPFAPPSGLDGAIVAHVEVLARHGAGSGALAHWGEVEPEEEGSLDGHRSYVVPMASASELAVVVLTPGGEPVPGAEVRLARDVVSLLSLKRRTDEDGVARFATIPKGRYVAEARGTGWLGAQEIIEHSGEFDERAEWVVSLGERRAVFGRVVDAEGRGVPDVLVAAHVDSFGAPEDLGPDAFTVLGGLPASEIAFTDPQGYYVVSRLPRGVAYLTAQSGENPLTVSEPIDLREDVEAGPIELLVVEGVEVEAKVVDQEGRPVEGALVTWRDEVTGWMQAKRTRVGGAVAFGGVSGFARWTASMRGWTSARTMLPLADKDGVHRVTLTLEPPGSRGAWLMRILTASGEPAEISSVRITRAAATLRAECRTEALSPTDWRVLDCAEGPGWLTVETSSSGDHVAFETWRDGVEVRLPEPTEVTVTISGLPDVAETLWRPADDTRWRPIPAARGADRDSITWTTSLFPGGYMLKVISPSETRRRAMSVGSTPQEVTWRLVRPRPLQVFVTDVRGAPLEGAHLSAWRGLRRVRSTTSQGRRGATLELEPGVYRISAIARGYGEGSKEVSVEEGGQLAEVVLEVSKPALSDPSLHPKRVIDTKVIASGLGAPVVRDGDVWLIDALDPLSAARKAGVKRGATLGTFALYAERADVLVWESGAWRWVSVPRD
ncbi:MAG: hypothetical protein AAGI01_10530 [Myxococcota bacterium]